MAIDNVLKLYSETIRSEFLHYGYWNNPELIDYDKVTLNEIKNAQNKYIENLSSYIPNNVKTVLDVGCGIGGNTKFLINKGYNVEALSPDDYQKSILNKKFNGKIIFHHTKFEDYISQNKYDLILESESACYIKIEKGFKKAKEILNHGGYLLVSDYFVYFRDETKNPHLKSSHDLNKYLSSAKEYGFKLIKEYDQTENTMPTLDYAKYFVNRFINPSLEYGVYSVNKNFPKLSMIFKKLVGSKFNKKKEQLKLINSNEFRKYRKYMIFLFQKENI